MHQDLEINPMGLLVSKSGIAIKSRTFQMNFLVYLADSNDKLLLLIQTNEHSNSDCQIFITIQVGIILLPMTEEYGY